MVSGILSLKSKGKAPNSSSEAPAASVAPVWHRPARGVGTPVPGAVGAEALPAGSRAAPRSPGARGTGAAPQYPGGAGKPEEPGSSPKALALPGAWVQQSKELRRKRKMRQGRGERGRGEWLRAEISAEVENPLSRTVEQAQLLSQTAQTSLEVRPVGENITDPLSSTPNVCGTRSLGANEMQKGVRVTQLRKTPPPHPRPPGCPEELFPRWPQLRSPGSESMCAPRRVGMKIDPPASCRSPKSSDPEASPARGGVNALFAIWG